MITSWDARIEYRLWMLTCAALVLPGCTPYQGPISGTTTQGPTSGPPDNLQLSAADDPLGTLAVASFQEHLPLSQMVDQRLPCPVPAECGGRDSVRIRIVPESHSNTVNWQSVLSGGHGLILAKINNMDSVAFGPWHLDANDTAFVWIGEISPGKPRNLGIFHVRSGVATFVVAAISTKYCRGAAASAPAVHMYPTPHCTTSFANGVKARDQLASTSPMDISPMLVYSLQLWEGCTSGCCEATFQ